MNIQIECDVTEYNTKPPEKNTENIFSLNEKSMIINFMNDKEKIIMQSEISSEDALKLARMIVYFYETNR
jgi:hypothetical protein